MQPTAHTILPEDGNNDVRPGAMPQPNLREDVDENGNPVLHEADPEGNDMTEKTETTEEKKHKGSSSSSGPEEKDSTDLLNRV